MRGQVDDGWNRQLRLERTGWYTDDSLKSLRKISSHLLMEWWDGQLGIMLGWWEKRGEDPPYQPGSSRNTFIKDPVVRMTMWRLTVTSLIHCLEILENILYTNQGSSQIHIFWESWDFVPNVWTPSSQVCFGHPKQSNVCFACSAILSVSFFLKFWMTR